MIILGVDLALNSMGCAGLRFEDYPDGKIHLGSEDVTEIRGYRAKLNLHFAAMNSVLQNVQADPKEVVIIFKERAIYIPRTPTTSLKIIKMQGAFEHTVLAPQSRVIKCFDIMPTVWKAVNASHTRNKAATAVFFSELYGTQASNDHEGDGMGLMDFGIRLYRLLQNDSEIKTLTTQKGITSIMKWMIRVLCNAKIMQFRFANRRKTKIAYMEEEFTFGDIADLIMEDPHTRNQVFEFFFKEESFSECYF